MLDDIQREAFTYFLDETNLENGLVFDTTSGHAPASIATVGLALTAYPVAVTRGLISRADAAQRTLTTLRFFWKSRQGPEPECHRVPRLLLSLSRHADGRARVGVRAIDC